MNVIKKFFQFYFHVKYYKIFICIVIFLENCYLHVWFFLGGESGFKTKDNPWNYLQFYEGGTNK